MYPTQPSLYIGKYWRMIELQVKIVKKHIDKAGQKAVSWEPIMSQSRIKPDPRAVPELSPDWMRELEFDAMQLQALVSSLDQQAEKALFALRSKNYVTTHVRLEEMRQGLRLLCDLCGFKLMA